ncbi:hypothetical protein AAG570_003455 [Ranatra chinensis]|uniref:Uncharacterized protein n=1 Tax=Ranatra chinensis TaxID=642074 RepID=A0ABD0Y4Y1_9HEMI
MGGAAKKRVIPQGSVREHLHDYCSSTSIHGVKYLGDHNRPPIERLWWLIIFILSMVGSGFYISKVWFKWSNSPVIVSFSETTTPVWQVPFPAVTLCSETKSRATVFNFTGVVRSNSTDELESVLRKMAGDVSLVCDPHVRFDGEKFTNESTMEILKEVAPSLENSLLACKWKNNVFQNCSTLFTPIITEDGLCYTFNMLDASELFRRPAANQMFESRPKSNGWSLEKGYEPGTPRETYPNRALDAGTSAGLFIVLKAISADFDYYCRGPIQGFKILLHNPAEIPSVGERYFRAPMKQEVLVGISPEIMKTNEGLRSYDAHVRQCYFPSERHLSHFNVYTQQNCDLECLTNFTLKACGCVAFHMPRDNGTPICGAGSKECMLDAKDNLRNKDLHFSYTKSEETACDCLPACSSLQYDAAISQADYDWISVIKAYSENETEFEGVELARLAIFFKDKQFITSQRSELFGSSDFLASCGGVLGLFSGISLLSIVEVIYYVTLRFWNNIHRRRRVQKEEHDEGILPFHIRH